MTVFLAALMLPAWWATMQAQRPLSAWLGTDVRPAAAADARYRSPLRGSPRDDESPRGGDLEVVCS